MMKKNKCVVFCLMAAVLTGASLFAQTEKSFADKLSFSLEFNASVLSADSEGVVDSMVADTGFDEDETKIGVAYEDDLWGASAALKFRNESLRFLSGEIGDMFGGFPLALDELYAWIKPFGEHFKFTGGIFENTDGIADYTDDIDNFDMGVFIFGEDGEPSSEPEAELTGPALTNGFLTDAVFGPVTLQFLLAPNYSKESASDLAGDLLKSMGLAPVEADARFFRIGGRVIVDAGMGTFSALFKTFQWPMAIVNVVEQKNFPGSNVNWTTFGVYFDLTSVENLGVSLGYTGFLPLNDSSDVDSVLYSGIDLRGTWTGIEGLSLSTHNNISFAQGAEKDWMGILVKDGSFFTLYNAIGATKELTEKFSVNAEIANVFSKTDKDGTDKIEYDNLGIGGKLIAKVGEHAEFEAGLRLNVENTAKSGSDDESVTTFSIPIGIKVNF